MAHTIADDAASPLYEQVRRWPRHRIDVPVRAILNKPDRILDGRGMEMSEGGVCLLMDVELGLGDKIELEFTPPCSGKTIRVRGEVCNRTDYFYGVKFIPEGEEERSEVARLRQMLNPFKEATQRCVGVKQSCAP
jgi:hypothetical protein